MLFVLLCIVCWLLFVVVDDGLFCVACCLLFGDCCVLCVVCGLCLLFVVCYVPLMFVVSWVPYVPEVPNVVGTVIFIHVLLLVSI